jgi:hypothetical protein
MNLQESIRNDLNKINEADQEREEGYEFERKREEELDLDPRQEYIQKAQKKNVIELAREVNEFLVDLWGRDADERAGELADNMDIIAEYLIARR